MARRFSLFRRAEPEDAQPAPAPPEDSDSAGFGFVTFAAEDATATGDPDQPIILGTLRNPPDADGGNAVSMEKISIAHEGIQLDGDKTEIISFTHEVKSPPDSAAAGETIQVHGQYDIDTTVEADGGPFAMDEAAADGPSTSVNLFRGEVTSIEPGFHGTQLPENFPDDGTDDLEVFD